MLLDVGRVCIKKFGRDAGDRAVITGVEENGFVRIVTERRNKERRCNPRHLEFLNQIVDVKSKSAIDDALGIERKGVSQTPKA